MNEIERAEERGFIEDDLSMEALEAMGLIEGPNYRDFPCEDCFPEDWKDLENDLPW